jgi:putative holliday junction resolvase
MSDSTAGNADRGGGAGRTLALDYGDRRIGIALSDELGLTARPLMTLTRTTWPADLDRLRALIRDHDVRRIVIGLPLDMDGRRGGRARLTGTIIEKIRGATGLPIIEWDERLTTVQAERLLISGDVSRARRRKVIDQVAAVILLQTWLDAQHAGGAPE